MNPWVQWMAGALARRASATPAERKSGAIFAWHGLGDACWTDASGAALAREGFARNPVVYRCVRMIAEAASSLPWILREGQAEIVAHPMLELLARPAPGKSGVQFLESLFGHLLVSGNAYVHAAALDGAPRELHLLRPDRVRIVRDRDGWPLAYEYGEGERKRRFEIGDDPAAILHIAFFDPLDDVSGMAPLQAARMALDIHNAACRWNKALLDNSARPSGALVYASADQGNLTEEQFARLKRELEEGYSGPSRAGRPMLLEGGLDWKAMGFSPRDMDFIEAKNAAARDIALAFGVPPMLLGIPGDLTYANYQEANRALWRQTVLPLSARVAAALGDWLATHYSAQLRLEFDRDDIEALAADREALWRRLIAADFLTADEKRAAAGYEPLGPGAPEPLPERLGLKRAFDPGQPRVPAGNSDGGQWTDGGGVWSDGDGGSEAEPVRVANRRTRPGSLARYPDATPAQEARFAVASGRANSESARLRELDPAWRPQPSLYDTIEGEIEHLEGVARQARERYGELTRDSIPGFNPAWGHNRLLKEMRDRGYRYDQPAAGQGKLYMNDATKEEVRVMKRLERRNRSDSEAKHLQSRYYRYRIKGKPWGDPVPVPDKE